MTPGRAGTVDEVAAPTDRTYPNAASPGTASKRRVPADELPTPRLRGRLHQALALLSPAATVVLVAAAGDSGRARVGALIYGLSLCTLFGVSAAYHRGHWGLVGRKRMKRLDHGAIFVLIAGTYTPICLVGIGGLAGTVLLVAAWVGGVAGVALALTGIAERRIIGFASYLVLGWMALAAIPAILDRLGGGALALLILGGALYSMGAVTLATRRPDPVPLVFGYHEVWHVFTLAAAACHFALVLSILRDAGGA